MEKGRSHAVAQLVIIDAIVHLKWVSVLVMKIYTSDREIEPQDSSPNANWMRTPKELTRTITEILLKI